MPRNDSAVMEHDEEQVEMFPELNDRNPKHKDLMKAARKFARDKKEREILSTAKEKVDASMAKLIALMHECELMKFSHEGIRVEIFPGKEKAQVKEDSDEEEGDGDGE